MKEKLQFRKGAEGFALIAGQPSRPRAPHYHDELEVNVVLAGKASYLFGTRRVPLMAGSMIWLFPRQEHVLIDCTYDFSMWVVVFQPALVDRRTTDGNRQVLRARDPGDIFCRQIETRRAELLNQVYESASGEDRDIDFVNAALDYALVASWDAYQFASEPLPRTDVHPAVAKAARLIAEAETVLSLDELAHKAGLSAPRLSRLFKHQTGTSLTAFRQRKSLERFLRIYRKGARYSLIEAALLAGFGSYPQFHRVFCRLMGMNPASYRKQTRAPLAK
jgi:AraC-like DNA-binding protein